MNVASSSQAFKRQGPRDVATVFDHPRLTKTNLNAIRSFLRDYDQYAREANEHAPQLTDEKIIQAHVSKPVELKFSVKPEWLESVIDLGSIGNVKNYDDLAYDQLCVYSKGKASSSKDVATIDMFEKI